MCKFLLFLGFIMLFTLNDLYGQEIASIVVDEYNEPIPYVNITIRNGEYNNYGWMTDDKGVFRISADVFGENDSLILSCIGFNKKEVAILELNINKENIIALQSKSYKLNEVVVSDSKLYKIVKEIGNHKNRTDGGNFFPLHAELSVFIKNSYNKKGYLKSIKIKLRKRELGLKTRLWKQTNDNSPMNMRMHVYSASENEKGPQDELLQESVIVPINTNKKWIIVDMEKYHIKFPKEGLFIGFRYLPANNITISDLVEGCPMDAYPTFRVQRGFVKEGEQCNTWQKYYKEIKTSYGRVFKPGQWYFDGEKGNYHPRVGKTNAILSAEITFYE